MPFEQGLPLSALKNWHAITSLDDDFVQKIKYFCGFQIYLAEEDVRKPSAIFVTTDDEVYAIGHNNSDNLLALEDEDFGKTIDLKEPRKIKELSGKKIKKLTVSERFGAALTEDGNLFYWGMDMLMVRHEEADKKYLKKPHIPNDEIEVAMMTCSGHAITYVTKNGELFLWGCMTIFYVVFYDFQKLYLPENVVFKSIRSGWYHVALLDDQGRAWTLGNGTVGELGYYSGVSGVDPSMVKLQGKCTKVECGANSTLFLMENGDVYACGNNLQLDHLCVGKEGHIFEPLRVLFDDPITDIMAAYNWSGSHWQSRFTALSSKGEYFKWGEDSKEKVPSKVKDVNSLTEMYVNFKTPQAYGDVVRTERDVVQGTIPRIMPDGISQTKPNPTDMNAGQPDVNAGHPDTNTGQTEKNEGLPETGATSKKPNSDPSVDTQPEKHPDKSQLNPDTTENKPNGPDTSASMRGPAGQEMINPAEENKVAPPKPGIPISILSEWSIFDSLDESFRNQITHFMVFNAYDTYVNELRLGSFLVTKDDSVYSFGVNTNEKLLGLSGQRAEEYEVDTPTKVDSLSGKKIKKIVIGIQQGVAVSENGLVFVWNQKSPPTQLKIDDGTPVDVACGPKFFLVLTSGSNIYLNGGLGSKVVENQKISIPDGVVVKNVECGDSHGAFVSTDGNAYTFGNGKEGQLGYEQNSEPSYEAKKVTLPQPCRKIACGVSSTIFLLNNGDVYACGANSYYDRLGVGHEKMVHLPEKVVIPDRATDIFALVRQIDPHLRGSTFFVETSTRGFFNWGTQFVASKFELWNVSTTLQAFRGQAIPQSISLVHLEPRDDNPDKLPIPEPDQQQSTNSEEPSGNVPLKNGGSKFLEEEPEKKGKDDNPGTQTHSTEDRLGDLSSLTSDNRKDPSDKGKDIIQPENEESTSKEGTKDDSLEAKKPTVENEESQPSPDSGSQDGNRPAEDGSRIQSEGKLDASRKVPSKNESQDARSVESENLYPLNQPTENGYNDKATPFLTKIEKSKGTSDGGSAVNELGNTLGDILGEQPYSDLTIKLSTGKISVHKVLLYTKSPFFRKALSENDNIDELDLSSYKPKSVLALLKHIYGVPIGEKASIDDAADFYDFVKKNEPGSMLELSKLLLYSSTLNDVIKTHLQQKEIESKEKILEAILPSKAFP